MHYSRLCSAALVALVVFAVPVVAVADDEAYEEMLDLSNEAAQAVADGDFEIGAVKFRQAYETYPEPVLLNNEMIAWYRADDCRNALPPARRFLETENLQPEDRVDVESVQIRCHIQLTEEALQEENAVLASYHLDSLSPLDLDAEDEQQYQQLRQRVHATFGSDDDGAVERPPAAVASPHSNTLPWLQISGGIAMAGLGLTLHAVALSRQSELRSLADSNHPADATRLDQRKEDWGGFQRTARWAVPTLYTVGVLGIGSGIFFLWRDRSSTEPSGDALSLSADITDEHLGLSLSGTF